VATGRPCAASALSIRPLIRTTTPSKISEVIPSVPPHADVIGHLPEPDGAAPHETRDRERREQSPCAPEHASSANRAPELAPDALVRPKGLVSHLVVTHLVLRYRRSPTWRMRSGCSAAIFVAIVANGHAFGSSHACCLVLVILQPVSPRTAARSSVARLTGTTTPATSARVAPSGSVNWHTVSVNAPLTVGSARTVMDF